MAKLIKSEKRKAKNENGMLSTDILGLLKSWRGNKVCCTHFGTIYVVIRQANHLKYFFILLRHESNFSLLCVSQAHLSTYFSPLLKGFS